MNAGWRCSAMMLLATSILACSGAPVAHEAAAPAVELVRRVPGEGPVGASVGDVTVRIRDRRGRPFAGLPVEFVVTQGGGVVAISTTVSSALGSATAGSWHLGPERGTNRLEVIVARRRALTLEAIGWPRTVAALKPVTPVELNGEVGAVVGEPSVLLLDQAGDPLANVVVNFRLASGGGAVEAPTARTNAAGIASAGRWILGPNVSQVNVLDASVPTLGPVRFIAYGYAARPESVRTYANDLQAGLPGDAVTPVLFEVIDRYGNQPRHCVGGRFAITSGGGRLSADTASIGPGDFDLDYCGDAPIWTLGAAPGPNVLAVTVPALGTVTFTAHALDPSALIWYELTAVQTADVLRTLPEAGIEIARLAVVRFDRCLCVPGSGHFLEDITWKGGYRTRESGPSAISVSDTTLRLRPASWRRGQPGALVARLAGDRLILERGPDSENSTLWFYRLITSVR